MYRYSVTQWIYGREGLEKSLARLKKYGYDGVELAGEPAEMDVNTIQSLLGKYSLDCSSICGIYSMDRDLSSSNHEIRYHAVRYVKACIDIAAQLGAGIVIVVPSPVGKGGPDSTYEEAWELAVASLQDVGTYAESKNIVVVIEALNRFETYLVNRLDTAKQLVQEVNRSHVRIMADLFHMNIEERSNREALRSIAPYLSHVHIADNTREAAGLGQINFDDVFHSLKEVGYEGYITMEFMAPVANPYLTAGQKDTSALADHNTQQAISHIKGIVLALAEKEVN